MAAQYGFYMDLTRCTGCKTCALACKDYKDLSTDRNFRRVYEYAGGSWQKEGDAWDNNVFAYYISVACNHCDKPACLEVCPVDAISKDKNGIVDINRDACIGCQSCQEACPYDAPQFQEEIEKMSKCDGCKDRVSRGEKPICVESCPLRALEFAPIEELRKKYGHIDAAAPLISADQTKPNIVIKPNRKTLPPGATMGVIANPLEV